MATGSANTAFIMLSGSGVGGAEKRFARAFRHLHAEDSSYSLIVNGGLYSALAELGLLADGGIEVVPEPLGSLTSSLRRKLYLLLYPALLHRLIRARRKRVAHLLGSAVYYGAALAADPRIKTVVSNYDVAVDQTVSAATRPLFSYVVRHADAIDALSDDIRERLLASRYNRDGRLADRVHVMPCSYADYRGFESAEHKRTEVVFLGRLVSIKRPLLLADAIPLIQARHPGARFLFLGRGPHEEELRRRIDDLGVGAAVTIDFATAPEEYLSHSSIFVSLQVDNNYPSQSLLEAMACENAVVATDVGETWKLVDDQTGVRIEPQPEALAAAINGLLDDPAAMRQLGRNARRRVLTEHTIERATDYLRALHSSV